MWLDKLSSNLKQEILNRNLPITQLTGLNDWPGDLIKLIFSFGFGNNKILQLINILNEISLRDGKPIDEPLKSPEWLEVYNNPKTPIFQKGLWLRQFLLSKRYPIYTEFRNKVKQNIDKLPENTSIRKDELLTLEKGSINFKDPALMDRNWMPDLSLDKGPAPEPIDPIAASKKDLCYTIHKGKFLKKCPGTPGYLCCNYYVLNIQTNCNYDCQYCILQGYINNDRLNIYTNIEDALTEVENFLKARPNNFYRIGTGELTDSLSLDHLTDTSTILIPFFMKQKNALLELKTKSNNIKNLLRFQPKGNIVVSWSLNPQTVINKYETGTASLTERLCAVQECSKNGYRIGFHFDPVILYPGWEMDYSNLIIQVFNYVLPKDIIWISIAGFRYTPKLKNIILARFPNTKLFLGEMIRCNDGKYRYIRPIRVNVYRKILDLIRQHSEDTPIYFCMESPTVWNDVFGKPPMEINTLKGIF